MSEDKIILRTEGLVKRFGALEAVSNISLALPENEFRAVIGPNGAGKTTLLDLIVNRLSPTEGKIYFKEKDITNVKPFNIVRMGLAKTFQISQLFDSETVIDNIRVPLIHKAGDTYNLIPRTSAYLEDEAMKILGYVNMQHTRDDIAGELSYGDQKRLEVAITLAMRPDVLLLDEPTAGVSREEGFAIMAMIKKLAEEFGMTLMFIEHDMDIVFNYADKITVLHNGREIVTDTPQNIRNNKFVQDAYFGGVV